MAKIPFKVSARTARLIGRENIASSKGAIIELVKNSYDADSPISLIYFNKEKDELFIIDSGEGMTEQIIIDHWMTIGTDNKANDIFTETGRVKAGAKGIGRFALDKLGDKCEMLTKFNPSVHKDIYEDGKVSENIAYFWEVDWRDFEGAFKTIGEVEANLIGEKEVDLKKYILDEIDNKSVEKILNEFSFEYGTVLKISGLRDNWDDFYVEQVFNDLEVLIPPKENSTFRLFLFNESEKNKYGEIIGSICDDYDYKIVAKADKNQNVNIKIYRNEYDIARINPDFFNSINSTLPQYEKEIFEKGYWEIEKTYSQLIKGFAKKDTDNTFSKIGSFEVTFYFMKRGYEKKDVETFYYKTFTIHNRKYWLNKFGGIKLFRDDFRVRPYGEINDSSFDWLGLGNRQAKSPAPVAHTSGSWKVKANNIAGAISITRLGNVDFQDKSSREGLQDNKTFQVFQKIILKILSIFEEDRAYIAKEMRSFHERTNTNEKEKKYADELAKKILEENRKK